MPKKLRILIVEKDKADRTVIKQFIKHEGLPYEYKFAVSVAEARKMLAVSRFDAVLIDYTLDDGNAFDMVEEIEEVPIVMITASGDEEVAAKAMKAGVSDYLIKDPEGNYLKSLPTAVENAISRRRAEEELRRYREQLEELVEERTAELIKANEQLREEVAERKRAEEENLRRAIHQETLNAVITAASIAPDLPELLESALRLTLKALKLEKGGIWAIGKYAIQGFSSEAGSLINQFSQLSETELLSATGSTVVKDWREVPQGDPLSAFTPLATQFAVRASITAPIVAQRQRIGGLSISSSEQRHWSPEEVDLVSAIGRQLGSAVERLRLLEEIQEQASRMQQIMNTISAGVILLDTKGSILVANPAAHDFLAAVMPPGKRKVGEVASLFESLLADATIKPSPLKLRHEIRTAGQPYRIFEVSAQPMGTGTDAGGWVLLVYDVTQEREIQQRMQQHERLAAVGQLAAGIAHDFNNIMAVIILYSELILKKSGLSEKDHERIATILQQAHRGASLTGQILDFSRRSVMEWHPVNLLDFLKELRKMLRQTLPETIHLNLVYHEDEYIVSADKTRLQQVFVNLALNARDAMPEGGELAVELSWLEVKERELAPFRDMPCGEWVKIRVSDTGQGISAEDLTHVFEPFFTTKMPGEGTGLGLAQVYGIVKQHKGFIDAQSRAGEGTTFMIYLPLLATTASFEPESDVASEAQGQGETILIVEDGTDLQKALCESLNRMNYQVLVADNGRKAVEIFDRKGKDIDLVITDLVLPEISGKEVCKELKRRRPDVSIIMMSGYPIGDKDRKELAEGNVTWVQKPITMAKLAQIVQKLLRG